MCGGESAMGEARVVRPDRRQLRWDMIDLEGLLAADHRARLVWIFVIAWIFRPFTIRFSRARGGGGTAGGRSRGSAFAVALCDDRRRRVGARTGAAGAKRS